MMQASTGETKRVSQRDVSREGDSGSCCVQSGRQSRAPVERVSCCLLLWPVCWDRGSRRVHSCLQSGLVALQPFQQMLNFCLNVFLPRGPFT